MSNSPARAPALAGKQQTRMDVVDSLLVNGSNIAPPCELGLENETLFCLDQPHPSTGRSQRLILIQKTIELQEKSAEAKADKENITKSFETRLGKVVCSEVWIRDRKAE